MAMCFRVFLFPQVLFAVILAAVQLLEASPASVSCKDSWHAGAHSCYKFFPVSAEWQAANSNCTAEGATLVTISSREENHFVNSLMQRKLADTAWIGLRRKNQEYVWHNGDPVGFQNWKNGEPNASVWAFLPELCVIMNKNGTWQSSICGNWEAYICKIGPPTHDGGHESKEKSYFSSNNWALVNHVFSVREASSELECAWLCLNADYCKSFNYKLVKLQCELNTATEIQHPMDFIRLPGSIYSSPRN